MDFGRGKKRKSWSSTARLHPLGLPSPALAFCLNSHLSPHRFPTWGFAPVKNWGTLEFGSSQTLPSSLSLMDQLEALTGEKPSCRNRAKPSKDSHGLSQRWRMSFLPHVLLTAGKTLIICAAGHSKHISHQKSQKKSHLQKKGLFGGGKKIKIQLEALAQHGVSSGLVSSP